MEWKGGTCHAACPHCHTLQDKPQTPASNPACLTATGPLHPQACLPSHECYPVLHPLSGFTGTVQPVACLPPSTQMAGLAGPLTPYPRTCVTFPSLPPSMHHRLQREQSSMSSALEAIKKDALTPVTLTQLLHTSPAVQEALAKVLTTMAPPPTPHHHLSSSPSSPNLTTSTVYGTAREANLSRDPSQAALALDAMPAPQPPPGHGPFILPPPAHDGKPGSGSGPITHHHARSGSGSGHSSPQGASPQHSSLAATMPYGHGLRPVSSRQRGGLREGRSRSVSPSRPSSPHESAAALANLPEVPWRSTLVAYNEHADVELAGEGGG